MIGRTLSHYRILEEIGRGGMGIVYRAFDTRLEREIALKVLPAELADDPDWIKRLKHEARAIAALRHPRIVTVFSVEEDDGVAFLTMEWIDGRPLARAIPRGGLSLERFFELAIPLADALATAHEAGIVHRDLKPGNIVLSADGRPTILDFGLARQQRPAEAVSELSTRTLEESGKIGGTVPYMSPEQLRGEPLDPRSDIFSFGIILFEMATGQHPFRSPSSADLISSILRDQPASVTDLSAALPRQLGRILRHALEKDPEHRLQTMKDLRNELEALRDELRADPLSDAQAAARPGRRAALVAAVAIALAGAALVPLLQPRPQTPARRPPYVEVAAVPLFGGPAAPDYLRLGLRDSLVQRLRGLEGAFVVTDSPEFEGDLRLEMDARLSGGIAAVSFRLLHGQEALVGDALQAENAIFFGLENEIGDRLTSALRDPLGYAVSWRPPPPPAADARSFEVFLRARHALRSAAVPSAETIAMLEAVVTDCPRFAAGHAALGDARRRRALAAADGAGLEPALASCQKAAALAPTLAPAQVCLGSLRALSGRHLEAAHAYLRAIEADPTALEAWEGLKRTHQTLGSPEAAESALRRAIAYRPAFWGGHYYLGRFFSDAGRYEAAIEAYDRAQRTAPDSSVVLTSLGGALFLLGRYEEATVTLHRSLAVHPTFAAYSNLGNTFFILRRPEEAVEAFRQAVGFAAASHVAWGNLARACYYSTRHRDDAGAALATAVELASRRMAADPDDVDTRLQLGLYRAMQGRREDALALLDEAIAQRPGDPHAAFSAGQIHNLLGEESRALDWLDRAVASGYSTAEIRGSVEFDNLRRNHRFEDILSGRPPPRTGAGEAPG